LSKRYRGAAPGGGEALNLHFKVTKKPRHWAVGQFVVSSTAILEGLRRNMTAIYCMVSCALVGVELALESMT
jgi:hypothetical protein